MASHVATVMNGQLQLDVPLLLPDNSRVTVTVAPLPEKAQQAWNSIKKRLSARPVDAQGLHFTRDELHERH